MVRSVPYFKDKGDSNSSAGWKVRDGPGRDGQALCAGAGPGPLHPHLLLLLVCRHGVGANAWCPRCGAWALALLEAPGSSQPQPQLRLCAAGAAAGGGYGMALRGCSLRVETFPRGEGRVI